MVTVLLLRTVTWHQIDLHCHKPTKIFIINFLFLNAWKLLNYVNVSLLVSHTNSTHVDFFVGRHLFNRKIKIQNSPLLAHYFQKLWKLWFYYTKYFKWCSTGNRNHVVSCDFKHFLRGEIVMISLAILWEKGEWTDLSKNLGLFAFSVIFWLIYTDYMSYYTCSIFTHICPSAKWAENV